jgi:hypothetical protein
MTQPFCCSFAALLQQTYLFVWVTIERAYLGFFNPTMGLSALTRQFSFLPLNLNHSALDFLLQSGDPLLHLKSLRHELMFYILFGLVSLLLSYNLSNGFEFLNSRRHISLSFVPRFFDQFLILAYTIVFPLSRIRIQNRKDFALQIFPAHLILDLQFELFQPISIHPYFRDCSLIRVLCS